MATLINRSRYRVTVRNRKDLTQHFRFDQLDAVEAHMEELRAQHYKPRVEQLDESWLVRFRDKGCKPLEGTFKSEALAESCCGRPNLDHPRRLNLDQGAEAVGTTAVCG